FCFSHAPAGARLCSLSLHDALPICHLVPSDVHLDRTAQEELLPLRDGLHPDASQVRPHAGDELPHGERLGDIVVRAELETRYLVDRKSTRLNSSHDQISYAAFCLKK